MTKALESQVLNLCGVLIVVMCVTLLLELAARGFFHHSFVWSVELATVCFIWIAFLGGTAGVLRKEHFVVDVLSTWFPEGHPVSVALELLSIAVILIIGVVFAVYGIDFVKSGMHRFSFSLGIRQGYTMTVMPICGALFIINSIYHLLVLVAGERKAA